MNPALLGLALLPQSISDGPALPSPLAGPAAAPAAELEIAVGSAHASETLRSLDLSAIRARSAGLTLDQDCAWATGPGYAAKIGSQGLEFAAGEARLALRPLGLEQGDAALAFSNPGAALELDGSEPRRGSRGLAAGVRERFEATPLGLEHSLWLASRPAGDGELVVRFALDSELAPRADGAGIVLEGVAGARLTIGAVTGIDARGRRAAGELRLAGEPGQAELHYVLPDAFLDAAAWPVLLDPLIGSPTTLEINASQGACVAHSGTSNGYLVAWVEKVNLAAIQGNLVAQRVSSTGALVGGQIAIDTTGRAQVARLGWSRLNNRYLAVWSQADLGSQTDLFGRTIDAANGALSSGGALLFTLNESEQPVALSNETSTTDDELLLLFDNGTGSTSLRQVTVPTAGVPAFTGNTQFPGISSTANAEESVALSTQGGAAGRFAYARTDVSPFANDLELRVLDRNAVTLTPVLTLADGSDFPGLGSFRNPAIDSDGERFVVAWMLDNQRVVLAVYRFDAVTSTLQTVAAPQVIATATSTAQIFRRLAVAWGPEGALVVWNSRLLAPGVPEQWQAQLIDTATGQEIGSRLVLNDELAVTRALASQGQGAVPGAIADSNQDDEFLVLLNRNCTSPCAPDLLAQRFTVQGRSEDLGGGCGAGGRASATGLTPGVLLRMTIDLGQPSATTYALLGLQGPGLPCGSCALWVDPSTLNVSTLTTNALGTATVLLAIPNNPATIGAVAAVQWVTPSLAPQCSALAANFSNALRLTIE